jgi:hypothetical protein
MVDQRFGFRDLPTLDRFTGSGRPPANRKKAPLRPTGPRYLGLGKKPEKADSAVWTTPPAGFLTAHNSGEEWMVYLAIALHLKDPPNPFAPPFTGGESWRYQKAEAPTTTESALGRVPGGSVSDFAIQHPDGRFLIIRLQTERFHIFTGPLEQEQDRTIDVTLRGVSDVIDIYSQDFLGDPTGNAVMRIVALALKGIEYASPTEARSALRVRRPR